MLVRLFTRVLDRLLKKFPAKFREISASGSSGPLEFRWCKTVRFGGDLALVSDILEKFINISKLCSLRLEFIPVYDMALCSETSIMETFRQF